MFAFFFLSFLLLRGVHSSTDTTSELENDINPRELTTNEPKSNELNSNEIDSNELECPVPPALDRLLNNKSPATHEVPPTESQTSSSSETANSRGILPKKRNFIGLQTLIFKYFYMPVKRTLAFLFEEVDNDSHFVMKKGLKDSEQVKKYKCLPTNETSTTVSYVPESSLMKELNKTTGCGLVLFYSPYCRFSVNILPAYKAVARVFPQLSVIAVKITSYSSSCIQFGAVGTPTVMFFFNSRPLQKMPVTLTNITSMAGYVANVTDLTPASPLELLESDHEGVELLHSFDWVLLFSVLFLSGSTCYNILSTQAGKRLLERFKLKRE